jgi:hypothetical protein
MRDRIAPDTQLQELYDGYRVQQKMTFQSISANLQQMLQA